MFHSASPFTWKLENKKPDCSFPDVELKATNGHLEVSESPATAMTPAYLKADVTLDANPINSELLVDNRQIFLL